MSKETCTSCGIVNATEAVPEEIRWYGESIQLYCDYCRDQLKWYLHIYYGVPMMDKNNWREEV